MEIIKHDIDINFVGRRKLALIFSLLLIVAGMVSLVAKGGPEYGIDFSGGTLIQVKFAQPTNAKEIKNALQDMNLKGLVVQKFEEESQEFLLRAQETSSELEGLGSRSVRICKNPTVTVRLKSVVWKWLDLRSVRTCAKRGSWPLFLPWSAC